jgi:DNA-binding LacI/PurR family transcriptional regulator
MDQPRLQPYEVRLTPAAHLLRLRPDLDGVFIAADLMASGALRVLRNAGREEMGRDMARLMVSRISGETEPQGTVLETRLVVRESA